MDRGEVKVGGFGDGRLLSGDPRPRPGAASPHLSLTPWVPTFPDPAGPPYSLGVRADVYSLGCTLFYLLTGEPPAAEVVPALTQLRPDVPRALAAVLGRWLADAPASRYQTAQAAAAAVGPFC